MCLLLLSMGLGSAVAPWLIDAWGVRRTLIATGLLLVTLAVAFLTRLTAIDGKISASGPELALLRQVSFFHPLPFAIVEHLTSELRTATYEPGDTIIREGEPGERFYIIAAGRARASKDGEQLREMERANRSGRSPCCAGFPGQPPSPPSAAWRSGPSPVRSSWPP